MRKEYVMLIGGTLLVAVALAGAGAMIAPEVTATSVATVAAATASGGSASEQAAALEAAEAERASQPPPPPSPQMVEEQQPPPQPAAPVASSYQGNAPLPSIQFGGSGRAAEAEVEAEPATVE
jgi:uncharacterized iron-regulated membrane protein